MTIRDFITVDRITYQRNLFRSSTIGTSDCNNFIPFYSIFAHDLLIFEETGDKVVEYLLPSTPPLHSYVRSYSDFFAHLNRTNYPLRYNFRYAREPHTIYFFRGLLFRDDTVYMCLGIDTEYVMSTPIEQLRNNLDVTKLTLFISNDFESVPEFKNLLKKVQIEYIDKLKELGVDIVYTSRINSWLYRNNYKEPQFRSVTKMKKHLEEIPNLLLE